LVATVKFLWIEFPAVSIAGGSALEAA